MTPLAIANEGAEPGLRTLAQLIANGCDAIGATINLIDNDRQWVLSEYGLEPAELSLAHQICTQAVLQRELIVFPNLTTDTRFAGDSLIADPSGFRFAAGMPLLADEGPDLGAICILDRKERPLSDTQRQTLEIYARHVMEVLELQRSARLLEEARVREQNASRAKDQFLRLLSHELRTPLTPALLSASMLMGDSSLDPTQKDAVAMIARSVKLQVRLVDDLLDFTRLEQNRLKLVRKPVDLRDVVREVINAQEKQADTPAIKCEFSGERTVVNADSARLKQVFRNILQNALKFTPASGRVLIEVADMPDDIVRVKIADTGIGISGPALPRIFEPFEQGNEYSAAKRGAGLGLGLAIAKGIVELHEGKLTAASAGHLLGATFTAELPSLETTPPVVEVTSHTQPATSPVSLRILLVEDQGATAVSLTRLLFRAGHRVLIADSVASARNIAERESFDVLVSDIGLPDGTGYDLMKNFRGKSFNHGIALSGHGSDEDRAESRKAGFVQHLTKPVDYSEVEQALNRVALEIFESSRTDGGEDQRSKAKS